jgi:hypothetical protein
MPLRNVLYLVRAGAYRLVHARRDRQAPFLTVMIKDGVLVRFGWCSSFALRPITPGTHRDRTGAATGSPESAPTSSATAEAERAAAALTKRHQARETGKAATRQAAQARSARESWQRERDQLGVEQATPDPSGNLDVVRSAWDALRVSCRPPNGEWLRRTNSTGQIEP